MKQSRRYGGPNTVHSLFLTLDDVLLLKQALLLLERLIVTNSKALPNIQLTQETLTQVQAKVSCLMEQRMWGETIPFHANEVVILHTAVRWFLVKVGQHINSPETYEALKLTLILQSKLALLAARTKRKR